MIKDYNYYYKKPCGYNLKPSEMQVYHAILKYANRTTWRCYPSVSTIMKDTGLGERTIRSAIKVLVDREIIWKQERRRDDKGNTSNMYFFEK